MAAPWEKGLSWLCEDDHVPTAAEAEELQDYFRSNPVEVELADSDCKCIPLHHAAYKQRGEHAVTIVKTLLTVYLDGVKQKNKYGNLPLHDAAWKQTGERHNCDLVARGVCRRRSAERRGWGRTRRPRLAIQQRPA